MRRGLFAEQASVLEGRGADLFMVETFYDLEELVDAIEAVRSVSAPAHRRADDVRRGRRDTRGVGGEGGGRATRALEVAAIGANHGAGLVAALLSALEQMQRRRASPSRRCPTSASPACRRARIYPHATPEYFAEFAAHAATSARG